MEERIARTDDIFRRANERIDAAAATYGVDTRVPFVCECADPTCREIIPLSRDQYHEVRSHARWFLNVPGHQAAAQGAAAVVAEREGYVIVETVGHAGEVAEAPARAEDARATGDQ